MITNAQIEAAARAIGKTLGFDYAGDSLVEDQSARAQEWVALATAALNAGDEARELEMDASLQSYCDAGQLPTRAFRVLANHGLTDVRDLEKLTYGEIVRIPGCGRTIRDQIIGFAAERGIEIPGSRR